MGMQEYELDAWLGGTPATYEQRAALLKAADACADRYKHDDGDAEQRSFIGAAMIILGDATLKNLAGEWITARRTERDAMETLTGAVLGAAAQGASEAEIITVTGINRSTVRKALGK